MRSAKQLLSSRTSQATDVHPGFVAPIIGAQVSLVLWPLLVLSGVQPHEAAKASIVVGLQMIPGVLLTFVFLRQRRLTNLELMGFGGVLGAFTFIVASQLALFLGIADTFWWLVPAGALGVTLVFPQWCVTYRSPSLRQTWLWFGLVFLGWLMLGTLWMRNPVTFSDWVAYFPDLSFHEGLAQGLAFSGFGQSPFLAGFPVRYHWFGNAWAGGVSSAADLSPYVATSRILYLLSLILSVSLAWAWATSISRAKGAGPLAALVLVAATLIGVGAGYSYSLFLVDISPTHTFAIPVAIATSFLATEQLRKGSTSLSLGLTVILGFMLAGSRVTQALVVLAGCFAVVAISTARQQWRQTWHGTKVLTSLVLGQGIQYLSLGRSPSQESGTWSLRLQVNADMASVYGLIPYNGSGGVLLASAAIVAAVVAGWSGALMLFAPSRRDLESLRNWSIGAGVAGILGVFFTSQIGRSQVSFLWAASSVILPISGVGLAIGLAQLKGRFPSHYWTPCLLGGGLGIGGVILVEYTRQLWFSGYLRWSAAVLPWLLAAAIAYKVRSRVRHPRAPVVLALISNILVSAAVGAGIAGTVIRTSNVVEKASPETPIAINQDHLAGANWIRNNVDDPAQLIATNRLCDVASEIPPNCVSTTFIVSALSGRPTLVEGFSYSVPSMPQWAKERINTSYTFPIAPSQDAAQYLWDMGVRYIWIDSLVIIGRDWSSYGDVVFASPTVSILKLDDPTP